MRLRAAGTVLVALAIVACGDAQEPAAPAPAVVSVDRPGAETTQYRAKTKGTPPSPGGGIYTCNEYLFCTCTGDAACNRMFEETNCDGSNSTCWEQTDSCYCHIDAESEVFWE